MRKIKFRAWDKENKKWIIGNDEIFIKIGHCYSSNINQNVDLSGLVIMQYTGLKDKNGKEIYEGDILQTKEFEINMKWVVEIPRVYLTLLPFGKIRQDNSLIIGNIYENPELLNNN